MSYITFFNIFVSADFVSLLKGVNEANEGSIFPTIVDRNAHRFGQLFQKGEKLFEKLESVKENYIDLTAIGSIDIEALVKENCSTAEDWDK